MSVSPVISVIIPVWNGEARIGAALRALQCQTAAPDTFEVIVVDNGSSDRTAQIVGEFDLVRLLYELEPGSYRARNRGLSEARGEFVLFTDADCIPNPDWVEQALQLALGQSDNFLIAGGIALFREDDAGRFASYIEELQAFNQEVNVRRGYCVTANWLCRRDVLRGLGGFRADLLSGGDVDCSRRMIAAGYPLHFEPQLVVRHPVRATLGALIAKRRRVLGGLWHMLPKRADRPFRLLYRVCKSFINLNILIVRSDIDIWLKPGIVAVAIAVAGAEVLEISRLAVGRPPYRS